MGETVPCPGCAAALAVEQDLCERCGRPRTLFEIDEAREGLRRRAAARRALPRRIAGWLALAALAPLLYSKRAPLLEVAGRGHAEVKREWESVSNPKPGAKPLSPQARALVNAIVPPASRETAETVPVPAAAAAPPPSEPEKPRLASRPPAPRPPPESALPPKRVYGVVYDLKTLAPVSGAGLSFRGSGWEVTGRSDGDGRYTVDLPGICPQEKVFVNVAAAGYREGQIEDPEPPYLERTPQQRADALAQVAPSDLEEIVFRCPDHARVIELGLVLVPK